MPGRLAKGAERKGVSISDAIVRLASGCYVSHELRLEYVDHGHGRLKRAEPAKDLVAVIASHSYGSNLARLLAYVERSGPAHVGVAVREVYGPLSELRKSRKKIRASLNHLVRLTADASDPSSHLDVPAVPIHSSKRVARQRPLGASVPSHNRPR